MSVTDLPDYTGYSDIKNVYGDVKIYTPSLKTVSVQQVVTRSDYDLWEVPAGSSAKVTVATGKGRFKRLVGLIYTTSETAYVNWKNIHIYIYADGDEKFAAGAYRIGTIDEFQGAVTVMSVVGKGPGVTWPPYIPGRGFKILWIDHDDLSTATYEPTTSQVGIFDLPFRKLAFEIDLEIEFENSLEIELLNRNVFTPAADVKMIAWEEWGEYL